jgi:ATP-dependent helicase/nuclease subunit A
MVLIMPTRTGLDVFDEVFAASGIPLAKESGTAFFRRDEIRGYQALLSALQNPRDEVSVAAFLLSPWVGLSLDEIRAHRDSFGLDYRGQEAETRVGEWLRLLDRWYASWWAIDPETLLFRVLEATGMRGTLTTRKDQAALANLDKLAYLSHHLGRSWGIDGFAQWMEEKVQTGANEEEGPLVGDLEAVHFSTVHRSKGLEWPLVIVTNWSHTEARHGPVMRGVGGAPVMKISDLRSPGWDEAIYQDGLRDAAEQQRLLYVALTRARDYLAVIDMWPANQADPFDFFTLSEHRMGTEEGQVD